MKRQYADPPARRQRERVIIDPEAFYRQAPARFQLNQFSYWTGLTPKQAAAWLEVKGCIIAPGNLWTTVVEKGES